LTSSYHFLLIGCNQVVRQPEKLHLKVFSKTPSKTYHPSIYTPNNPTCQVTQPKRKIADHFAAVR